MAENMKQIQQLQSQSAMSKHQRGTTDRCEGSVPRSNNNQEADHQPESTERHYGQVSGTSKDASAPAHFNT